MACDARVPKKTIEMSLAVDDAKQLVAELCAGLYVQGHVSGTGGGISIKAGESTRLHRHDICVEGARLPDVFDTLRSQRS